MGDNFSQQAFNANHRELVAAIERALASSELADASDAEKKQQFVDTVDVLKEEASKEKPDAGKLRRWGERGIQLAKDLGMKVATSEIAYWLHKIFV
ncbi:hypothetical protein ACVME8_000142 [Bradyrhizobium diazoefficiens]